MTGLSFLFHNLLCIYVLLTCSCSIVNTDLDVVNQWFCFYSSNVIVEVKFLLIKLYWIRSLLPFVLLLHSFTEENSALYIIIDEFCNFFLLLSCRCYVNKKCWQYLSIWKKKLVTDYSKLAKLCLTIQMQANTLDGFQKYF